MFNLPGSLVFVIAFLALVHLVRDIWLTAEADAMLLQALSFVPGRFTFSFNPDGIADELTRLANTGSRNAVLAAQFFLGDGHGDGWSMFTYSILHADWTHVGVFPGCRRRWRWRALSRASVGLDACRGRVGLGVWNDGGCAAVHISAGRPAGKSARRAAPA
jgi:hypothetical protein